MEGGEEAGDLTENFGIGEVENARKTEQQFFAFRQRANSRASKT